MGNKIKRFLSTCLIFCLLVCLVCLSFVYMFSFQISNEMSFGADDMAELEQNFAAAGYMDNVSAKNIMPVFVGVSHSSGEERVGAFCGEALENLYADCFEIAGQYLARGLAEEISEASAEDFVRMAKNNGFIYIKYAAAYPKSVIMNFSNKDTFAQSFSDEYIREIFVFYNNYTASVCAMAFSEGGNSYLYTGSFGFEENFNNNIANEYNNAEGTFDFTFASEEANSSFISKEAFSKKLYSNAVIPETAVEMPNVSFCGVSDRLEESGVYEAVLSVFTLNPEKISVFTESDGTITFFEEGQNVGIGTNGRIGYSAVGMGGISVGSVIGYNAENEEYSLRDKIGATLLMAEEIAEIAGINADISIKLSGISYDESGNLVITYYIDRKSVV